MEKIKGGQILTYGMGSMAKDLVGGMVSSYLLIFYTDVFGIPAAAAGLIMMLTRLWDAINDPIMGAIVDKTNTKWGRYRPYILISPLFITVFYWLTFTTPGFESMTAKIVWAAVTYTLAGMAFTAYDVPLWGMVPSISSDPNVRNKLITSQRVFTFVSYMIAMSFAYPLIAALGGGDGLAQTRAGYSRLVLIFGIVGVLFAWLTFFTNKERIAIPKERHSFRELAGVFIKNNHAQRLLLASLFMYLATNIGSAVNVFFITYNMGLKDLITPIMLVTTIAPVFGMLAAVPFAKKFGRKKATLISICAAVAVNVLLLIFGTNLYVFIPLVLLAGIMVGVPGVTIVSMVADAADYTHWSTKMRIDGIIFSLNSFVIKLGMAIASGLSGFLLALFKYVPNAADQASTALAGIRFIRFGLPIIPLVYGILLMTRYKLSDEKMQEIRAELANMRYNDAKEGEK